MFKSLKPLSPYLRKYRGTFAIGALCVLCNNGIWILFPIVIRSAVQALNTEVSVRTLARYALYLMGVSLAKGVFQYLTRWIRSEEHTSELQSPCNLVCRLL